MLKILMVCHGNICRSVCAEMVMKHLIRGAGLDGEIAIASAATTTEEIGNDVYPPMRRTLIAHGIPVERHSARKMTRADGEAYDLLIGMDEENLEDMARICGANGKLRSLMTYAGRPGAEVADPWYTRDFEAAYRDVLAGCEGLLRRIREGKAL